MSKIILSPYQATVFKKLEKVLQKRGNPQGIKVNPKGYWLSKRVAVYIMHNIAKSHHSKDGFDIDVENVYIWLFGATQSIATTQVSNTGTTTTTTTTPTIVTNNIGLGWGHSTTVKADNSDATSTLHPTGVINTWTYQNSLSVGTELTKIYSTTMHFNDNPFFKIITSDESITVGDVIELEKIVVNGIAQARVISITPSSI
jgi:predicted DNA-binding antitoxin AbrB/MazE fold protein